MLINKTHTIITKALRRRPRYSAVVATLALLFAMSGGALAANHYLISSIHQISPSVVKQLKGRRGKTGPQGPTGPTGPRGATGATGSKGATGPTGATGAAGFSALSTLPSGQSESGDFGVGTPAGSAGETVEASVSFPISLEERAPEGQVVVTTIDTPVTHCSGPGHADKGFLCIYYDKTRDINTTTLKVFDTELHGAPGGSGRFGFMMAWTITGAEPSAFGTYTVTAG